MLSVTNTQSKIPAKLYMLYLSMGSMIMFFSATFSALIVKKGDTKHWMDIPMPSTFLFSTIIIIISSVLLELTKKSLGNNSSKFKLFGYLSIISAIIFLLCQYFGWQELQEKQIFYAGHPSGSFVYFISCMHALHYVGGILFLIYLVFSYRKLAAFSDNEILNSKILTQFWHFIGFIWIVIFLFFKFFIYN